MFPRRMIFYDHQPKAERQKIFDYTFLGFACLNFVCISISLIYWAFAESVFWLFLALIPLPFLGIILSYLRKRRFGAPLTKFSAMLIVFMGFLIALTVMDWSMVFAFCWMIINMMFVCQNYTDTSPRGPRT